MQGRPRAAAEKTRVSSDDKAVESVTCADGLTEQSEDAPRKKRRREAVPSGGGGRGPGGTRAAKRPSSAPVTDDHDGGSPDGVDGEWIEQVVDGLGPLTEQQRRALGLLLRPR